MEEAKDKLPEITKFPLPSETADETGANLDLRVRMAGQILTSSAVEAVVRSVMSNSASPNKAVLAGEAAAAFALAAATELLRLGEQRGLVTAPAEFAGVLSPQEIARAGRRGSMAIEFQVRGNKYAAEQAGIAAGEASGLLLARPGGPANDHPIVMGQHRN